MSTPGGEARRRGYVFGVVMLLVLDAADKYSETRIRKERACVLAMSRDCIKGLQ